MLENITATAKRMAPNAEWDTPNNGWKVTLRNGRGNSYTVSFYKGVGLPDTPPTALEVLECLVSDAAGYRDATGFEDWAENYGYDTDSRAAEKTYKACKRIADRLGTFLTAEEWNAALELDR